MKGLVGIDGEGHDLVLVVVAWNGRSRSLDQVRGRVVDERRQGVVVVLEEADVERRDESGVWRGWLQTRVVALAQKRETRPSQKLLFGFLLFSVFSFLYFWVILIKVKGYVK